MVEGGVGEGDRSRGRLDELDPAAEAGASAGEHVGALVEAGDDVPAGEQPLGDEARPGGDVEHRAAVVGDVRDEGTSPARILSERERRPDAVVLRAKGGEESAGVGLARGHSTTLPCFFYPGAVPLLADLERIATIAAAGVNASAVLAAEPTPGVRAYLCAFEDEDGARSWLVVDDDGEPISARRDVRDVIAITALCEIAEESAVGGDLDELLSQLVALRLTENPDGIDEAEDAVRALQHTIGSPPQLATPARLDAIGAATRRLEQALDPVAPSPFTAALKSAQGTIDELQKEIESTYRVQLTA